MVEPANILILTGAGISAESGLSTFRDRDGIWSQYDYRDVATPEGFARDPELVHKFYNIRRARHGEIHPNAAHEALARLEQQHAGTVAIVTQNVDNLHERAGSQAVVHMHGEILKARCSSCQVVADWRADLTLETCCTGCNCSGGMRPHVVWFGETPLYMNEIGELIHKCDLFISIGTSGNVYPAAGFVGQARALGRAHTVELNLEPSEGQSLFAEKIYGRAADIVPTYVDSLLS